MLRIIKQIKKISLNPQAGKPLSYEFKNKRSIRVPPFRIIYTIERDYLLINFFEHRKEAYD